MALNARLSSLDSPMCRLSPASTIALTRFDVSSAEPGGRTTLICAAPSSNAGRKSEPRLTTRTPAITKPAPTQARIAVKPARLMLTLMTGVTARLRNFKKKLSCE